jgi:hypothetical protein
MVEKSGKNSNSKQKQIPTQEVKDTSVYVKNGSLMLVLNVKPNSKTD